MKIKEKQKKRKAYEPKLTQEELMDSSTFKRFLNSIDNILENLEDLDFTAIGKCAHCGTSKGLSVERADCLFENPNAETS